MGRDLIGLFDTLYRPIGFLFNRIKFSLVLFFFDLRMRIHQKINCNSSSIELANYKTNQWLCIKKREKTKRFLEKENALFFRVEQFEAILRCDMIDMKKLKLLAFNGKSGLRIIKKEVSPFLHHRS